MIKLIVDLLAWFILATDVIIVAIILIFVAEKITKKSHLKGLRKIIAPNVYYLVFLLTLGATISSVFLSEVAKLPICVLCWYQRIFLFPQPFLIYLAIVRNEKVLTPYLILLNSIGAVISIYQYIIQMSPKLSIIPCNALTVSCTDKTIFYFGYMTIPIMALTAFVLNLILLTIFNNFEGVTRVQGSRQRATKRALTGKNERQDPEK